MCGLYGVLSYGNEIKDIAEITEALRLKAQYVELMQQVMPITEQNT